MCGRYQFDLSDSKKSEEFKKQISKQKIEGFKTGEIFPGDKTLVVVPKKEKINLVVGSWGMGRLINARVETLGQRPKFKGLKKCCVIANSFYEWRDKQKYQIGFNDEFVYFAAIMNNFDELVILTKDANDSMKEIHERMPVVLNQEEMINYLTKVKIYYSDKELVINKISK